MIFSQNAPCLQYSCGGTARHYFATILSEKLFGEGVLITCAELWLEKIMHLQKAVAHSYPTVDDVHIPLLSVYYLILRL